MWKLHDYSTVIIFELPLKVFHIVKSQPNYFQVGKHGFEH